MFQLTLQPEERRYSQREYEARFVYGHNGLTREELDRIAELENDAQPKEKKIIDNRSPWEKPEYDWRQEKDYS